jgi:hypothetical protein
MSYNGSGTFVINSAGQPVVSGTVISSTAFNALTADLATGLSTAITKDGQTTITANIPMANYKFTGLGTGSAAGDSANLSQVQSTAVKLLASVSGADTITAVGSPNVAAYVAGQMFYFVAAGANTGAVTINIDSLGAKSITRDGTTALAAGDIQSGEVCVIVYDGTQFQLVNGASQSASIVTENLTVNKATVLNESGGDNDTRIEGDTDPNLVFVDASTDRVGFGTNTPATKVDITGTVTADGLTVDGVVDVNGGQIDLDTDQPIRWGGAASSIYAGSGSADMVFIVGSAERFRVNGASGNLGIGTSSPNGKIESVNTNSGADTLLLQVRNNASAASTSSSIRFVNSTSSTSTAGGAEVSAIRNANDGGALTFKTAANSTATLTERLRLDSAGNLGLGVTPSAWSSNLRAIEFSNAVSIAGYNAGATPVLYLTANSFDDGTNNVYKVTAEASRYIQSAGEHRWSTAPSGTAGNTISFTQAMTLTAAGNQLLGTTSETAGTRLKIVDTTPAIRLEESGGGSKRLDISVNASGEAVLSAPQSAQIIAFSTVGSERARITSGGVLLVNRTSNQAAITDSTKLQVYTSGSDWVGSFENANATTPYGIYSRFSGASPNNATAKYLLCDDTTTTRAEIRSNGGLANYQSNNVDLSDIRTKKDIASAPSYWDKIGALEIVTYKYNDQSHDDVNVGVIAQQVEAVEPVWVDSDGFGETPEGEEPLKTVYTKDITFAAIKALQEAMTRIEALEAEVAALKGAN